MTKTNKHAGFLSESMIELRDELRNPVYEECKVWDNPFGPNGLRAPRG